MGNTLTAFIYLAMLLATSITVWTHHEAYEGEELPPAAYISESMGLDGLVHMVSGVTKPSAPNMFYEYFAPRLARHAGNGSAHRARSPDCAGIGLVGHQVLAAEEYVAGENGVLDSEIGGWLVS